MTDEPRKEPKRPDPNERVRIIGPDEAAEALERGDVARRRPADEPRFGDRPARPTPKSEEPRPVLRFPLSSSSDAGGPISEPVELPHWTEPATGQVPSMFPDDDAAAREGSDDWTNFTSSSPRWRDDVSSHDEHAGFDDMREPTRVDDDRSTGALDATERPSHDDYFGFADLSDAADAPRSVFSDEPAPGAGFDEGWDTEEPAAHRVDTGVRSPADTGGPGGPGGPDRDIGLAVAVGVGLLAVALVLFNIGPAAGMILVTAVIGLAAAEFFGVLRQVGYEPVTLAGIAGSVGLVLGAYNNGTAIIPSVLFLTVVVCLLWYLVGAASEAPVMNVGVTLLGVCWVGLLGSFAALMLGFGEPGIGVLLATVLGTIGYDVGALFVGRNAGRQQLSAVSPNKTVEGLLGGVVGAVLVVVLIASVVGFGPIEGFSDGLLVGLVIAVAAPLGDLCESLLKRDLGVKDMGSLLPAHGGLLDRFDALLFALPAVYLLVTVRNFF